MRRDLLLDANFLVLPFQFNVEIFDEFERLVGPDYQVFTLDRTLNEAINMEDGKYRELVQRLVDLKDIEVLNVQADMPVDDQLIALGREGFIVCTNDTAVRNELDEMELPCIYLRQQNHLEAARLR